MSPSRMRTFIGFLLLQCPHSTASGGSLRVSVVRAGVANRGRLAMFPAPCGVGEFPWLRRRVMKAVAMLVMAGCLILAGCMAFNSGLRVGSSPPMSDAHSVAPAFCQPAACPAGMPPPPVGESSSEVTHNTETYTAIEDNSFLAARQNPLSTFGIDVDTASYSIVRRFLTDGS